MDKLIRNDDLLIIYANKYYNHIIGTGSKKYILLSSFNDPKYTDKVFSDVNKIMEIYNPYILSLDGSIMFDSDIESIDEEQVMSYGMVMGYNILCLYYAFSLISNESNFNVLFKMVHSSDNYNYYTIDKESIGKLANSDDELTTYNLNKNSLIILNNIIKRYDYVNIFPITKNIKINDVITLMHFNISLANNNSSDQLDKNVISIKKGNMVSINELVTNAIFPYIKHNELTYNKLDYRVISRHRKLPGYKIASDNQKIFIKLEFKKYDTITHDLTPSIGILRSLKLSGILYIETNLEKSMIQIDTGKILFSNLKTYKDTEQVIKNIIYQNSENFDNVYPLYFIFIDNNIDEIDKDKIIDEYTHNPIYNIKFDVINIWYKDTIWKHINDTISIEEKVLTKLRSV